MANRIVAPSVLSADFGNLSHDIKMLDRSEAQWVHIDVMDGVFVPNISFGFPVMKPIVANTSKFLDVHLMIVEPERYVERFIKAGASMVTVHVEATAELGKCIDLIRSAGAKVGVSIKPATPVSALESVMERIDMVLIMSVEPGFGGQSFIESSLDKVRELRAIIDSRGLNVLIEIDGGISAANAGKVWASGVDVVVAGNAIFRANSPEEEIVKILEA